MVDMMVDLVFAIFYISIFFTVNAENQTIHHCEFNNHSIGLLTPDGCIRCQPGEYFSRFQESCSHCGSKFTNSEDNILFYCSEEKANFSSFTAKSVTVNQTSETSTNLPLYTSPEVTTIEEVNFPYVKCDEYSCGLVLKSREKAINKMLNFATKMFHKFTNDSIETIPTSELHEFIESFEEDHEEENETHKEQFDHDDQTELIQHDCTDFISGLVEEYFGHKDYALTSSDFLVLLPRILFNMQRPECRDTHEDHENGKDAEHENIISLSWTVWLIAFGSVLLISVFSVIGILLVPLMKHSIFYNRLISFLVALAVGTLVGDALLHLLPHSAGIHSHQEADHSGHEDEEEDSSEHYDMVWKGLVAVFGIYIFYLVETMMVVICDIKKRRKVKKENKHELEELDVQVHSHPHNDLQHEPKVKDNGEITKLIIPQPLNNMDSNRVERCCTRTHHQGNETVAVTEDGPHHHVEGGAHMHNHEVPTTIANLAWMVVMGDGLHNFSDGLAIGAAFTSSIGAGLSTSIAVFCHELPHELGDFAILINAGMSVKQALIYNFLCACLAFVGLIIGMIIGEYTNTYKLWILAFTAGGFLYIALVDMIPQMLVSLRDKDSSVRFISQNTGLLLGIMLMLLIALREHSFEELFVNT